MPNPVTARPMRTLSEQKETLDKQHAEEQDAQRLAAAERETLQEQDAYKDAVSAVANAPSRPARQRQRRNARNSAPARHRPIFSPHSND
jgi:predicted ribosome quality control (RQC) complex YloA/Tae2 family protein